ncbi:hypothetical protein BDR26DRAFT_865985 [Obelidium mucronatum]|nr:hypothetical protein BDR26DRAFT_865985 [Obelidium mucronatum]
MDHGGLSNNPRVDKGALLPADTAETWLDRITAFYLIPEGPFMANWDRMMVFCVIVNCILLSFMAAFRQLSPAAFVIGYLIDALCLADVFVKFHVAYLQGGFWVVFPRDMAYNYIASPDFKYDVICNLFFLDLIALAYGVGSDKSLYILSLIRLVKMIRGVRILGYFYKQEKKLHASFLVQILKFVSLLVTSTHCMACVWFAIACPQGTGQSCNSPSWADTEELFEPHKTALLTGAAKAMYRQQNAHTVNELGFLMALPTTYCFAIYWTVTTMTTTGYGDIRPETDAERLFAILAMTSGVFFFGYISGTIASALSNMDSRRVSYQQKMDAVRQYMNDRNMDSDMQERVLDYYDYVWERNKGIDVRNLFDDMPSTFKGEVALSLNNTIIDKATMFRKCSNGFRRLLAIHMKLYLFTANEYVIHKGDLGVEMFFITQGRIDVYATEDLRRPTSSLIEGAHFGEFQIILEYRHEYSARAVCNTDIYVLKKADLDFAFSCYPEDRELVRLATEDRYKQAQNAKKSRKAKMDEVDLEDDDLGSIAPAHPVKDSTSSKGGRRQSLMPALFRDKSATGSNSSLNGSTGTGRVSMMQDIFKQHRRASNMADIEKQMQSNTGSSKRLSDNSHLGPAVDSGDSLRKSVLTGNIAESHSPVMARHSLTTSSSLAGIPPHSRVQSSKVNTAEDAQKPGGGAFVQGILRRTKSQKSQKALNKDEDEAAKEEFAILSAGSAAHDHEVTALKTRSAKGSQVGLFKPIHEGDEPPNMPARNISAKNSSAALNKGEDVPRSEPMPAVSSRKNSIQINSNSAAPVAQSSAATAESENLVALEGKEMGPRQSREDCT